MKSILNNNLVFTDEHTFSQPQPKDESYKRRVGQDLALNGGTIRAKNIYPSSSGGVASTVIAPSYSSSLTYSVGDMIMYNNSLYECTVAISSPEEFTPSHWKQGDVASLIIGLINEEL